MKRLEGSLRTRTGSRRGLWVERLRRSASSRPKAHPCRMKRSPLGLPHPPGHGVDAPNGLFERAEVGYRCWPATRDRDSAGAVPAGGVGDAMCGIVVDFRPGQTEADAELGPRMLARVRARGPDGDGAAAV